MAKRVPHQRLEDVAAAQDRRVELALDRFRVSYMSDAKWRKALRTLAAMTSKISGYRWKMVDEARVFSTAVVREEDIDESHLIDGRLQPFVYKDVEWLEVLTTQPIQITTSLADVGKFAVHPGGEGIRILGYG